NDTHPDQCGGSGRDAQAERPPAPPSSGGHWTHGWTWQQLIPRGPPGHRASRALALHAGQLGNPDFLQLLAHLLGALIADRFQPLIQVAVPFRLCDGGVTLTLAI